MEEGVKLIEKGGYIEAVGRRKTAIARVRISKLGGEKFVVNEKELKEYFPTSELIKSIKTPFSVTELSFDVSARVKGGGTTAQAEAIRHGISRAIIEYTGDRKTLKREGLLKRDPRKKERKKFGLKKARKSPQWSKR